MQCDSCGREDAVIQLTSVVDNEMKVSHLCDACAAEKGIEPGGTSANAPLVDFLAQIGKSMGEGAAAAGRCPACGLSGTQLKQVGRLGCSACYAHFEPHLRGLLRRLHGGTQHVGKVALAPDPQEADRIAGIQSLRRKLERAVEAEDFERAVSLRDQIRELESET